MALPPLEALYEQLCALRDAEDPTDPRHEHRWRVVADWLERAFPGGGDEGQDARQETLISLFRSISRMQAEAPKQAAKWISTILKRKRIDAIRARNADPVRQALRFESARADATPTLDRLGCEGVRELTPAMLEGLVTLTLEHTHRALEEQVKNASKRQLRRTQAQATLLRLVCGWPAEAIVEALDYGEPIANDRLYKWIERGRAPVELGLDRWAAQAEGEEVGVIEVLREIISERRADAGQPRLERRKDAEGPEGAS
ncbi:MAG: hypothetical protein H6719_31820 [Sandaracinaceae bacterium]|nr:hypothetical protein [Sandaracinaceae bacterium]